ncbi:MAG: V-type ATP synthase subunit F [Archangium sp.]|nr:V-type ATP synthase subunit F [Archangium sp.]
MSEGDVVRVVCRPQLAPGFELAGVTVDVALDGPGAAEVLRRLAAEPKNGIVLVDDVLHRALPDELRARLERQPRPLVTPFPAPAWDEAAEAEAYVLEILRQAIGYRVRPR